MPHTMPDQGIEPVARSTLRSPGRRTNCVARSPSWPYASIGWNNVSSRSRLTAEPNTYFPARAYAIRRIAPARPMPDLQNQRYSGSALISPPLMGEAAMRFNRGISIVLCTAVLIGGCVTRVRQVTLEPLEPAAIAAAPSAHAETSVKAHLLDGSTVVYIGGVWVRNDSLYGQGRRYDLLLRDVAPPTAIPLDSVAGLESYRTGTNMPASVGLTVAGTALGAVAAAGLAVAVFGSCPTIYSDSAGTFVLEAESFSYSIAPLFETRDVDRLGVRPDSVGVVRLEVRNEALETHYLNHLELLEVSHDADETVVPDVDAKPLVVRGLRQPMTAVDRDGRDVNPVLRTHDGEAFATEPALLAAAHAADMRDHIDLVFEAPRGVDSAAVLLRLRNSLLTTILLYDVMLGSQGAGALDWLGSHMAQVGGVLELGQWYRRHMGLRVSVWEDGEYREAGRIADSGPIAWKDVAAVVPVPAGDSLRVRLSLVMDAWRIDRVALATAFRRPDARTIAVDDVTNATGAHEPAAITHLRAPDEQYLETTPGQRFDVAFRTGGNADGAERTYLLAAQGHYSEWIRPGWIRDAVDPAPLVPGDDLLLEALVRWRTRRASFEAEFYNTRIPVR
jgi:hypothetical protein